MRRTRVVVGIVVTAGLITLLATVAAVVRISRGPVGHKVANIARGVLERPAPADVARPRRLSFAAYSVSIPGNWHLEEDPRFHRPEVMAEINAPGRGRVILYILDPGGGPAYLQMRERLRIWRLDTMREMPFSTWGRYEGEGIDLAGSVAGSQAHLRLFTHEAPEAAFGVLEIRWSEHEERNAPGFELIESTFVLR